MKKVLLTGTALLAFAAAGFAQTNTTTTNQAGDKQTAVQTQTGNYLTSTVTQDKGASSNFGSFAATRQVSVGSDGNQATVEQKNASNSNRGYVTQITGTGNVGTITQNNNSGALASGAIAVTDATSAAAVKAAQGNWAGILQSGSNNKTTSINQSDFSSTNFGEINQFGSTNGKTLIDQSNRSSGNTAKIDQGTASAGVTASKATILQQSSSRNNQAFIAQIADNNTAAVTQNESSVSNVANVSQSGTYGIATVNQGQDANFNKATVTQDTKGFYGGKYNTATINQTNLSGQNAATIEQHGIYEVATINQAYSAVGNEATIQQQGYASRASISQYNVSNSKATIKQDLVTQSGGIDVAEIQQGSTSFAASDKNVATITQDYSYNTAKLRQYGNGNTATLTQQIGDKNVIKGLGTDADGQYALQQGNNNTLTVTQNSGTSNYVPNVANVSQIGNGNMATISQTGAN